MQEIQNSVQRQVNASRRFNSDIAEFGELEAGVSHGRLNVINKVIHHFAGVAFFQSDFYCILRAFCFWSSERQKTLPQPAIESFLFDVVVIAGPAQLDGNLFAQALVATLFLDDFAYDLSVGLE